MERGQKGLKNVRHHPLITHTIPIGIPLNPRAPRGSAPVSAGVLKCSIWDSASLSELLPSGRRSASTIGTEKSRIDLSGVKMPFIDLQSNLPASSFSDDFLKKLCACSAAALDKPQERVNVVVHPGLPMMIAGSCSPCVVLSVSAISVTDTADKNKEHSAKIFEFLTGELGLTDDRIVIQFHALQPHQVGKNRTVMSFL